MNRRWMITCVFLMLINKASLESTVEAFVGGSVILPCQPTGGVIPENKELTVSWRYKDHKKVFGIFQGSPTEDQDPDYKGRTKSFESDAYANGNFSIALSRVTASDEGEYFCRMHFVPETLKVHLRVKAAPPQTTAAPPQTTAAPPQTTKESTNKGVESRCIRSLLILTVLLGYNVVLL